MEGGNRESSGGTTGECREGVGTARGKREGKSRPEGMRRGHGGGRELKDETKPNVNATNNMRGTL